MAGRKMVPGPGGEQRAFVGTCAGSQAAHSHGNHRAFVRVLRSTRKKWEKGGWRCSSASANTQRLPERELQWEIVRIDRERGEGENHVSSVHGNDGIDRREHDLDGRSGCTHGKKVSQEEGRE